MSAFLACLVGACSSDARGPDIAGFEGRGEIDSTELEAIHGFLEQRIRGELESKNIPAISIALIDDQGRLWSGGFGQARPAQADPDEGARAEATAGGVPASSDTVYRVGSVSKLFTDIAVMQRVERGELDLDAPITDVLPEFRPDNPFGTEITLRQLMCHRAGLVREPPVGHYFDDTEPTLRDTVLSLNQTRLVYEPGTVNKYSNAGIAVVGYVLEKLSGQPFDRAVRDAVLDPLGMAHSDFVPSDRVLDRLAAAEMRTADRRRFEAPTFQLGMAPAGSLYSTVDDLALFTRALLKRQQLLEPTSLDEMFTPQFSEPGTSEGYGLGFAVGTLEDEDRSLRRLGHGGAIYGFSTQLVFLPDEGLGVAVISNLDFSNGVVGRIADEALELLVRAKHHTGVEALDRLGQSFLDAVPDPLPDGLAASLSGHWRALDQQAPVRSIDLIARGERLFLEGAAFPIELRYRKEQGRRWLVPDDPGGRGAALEIRGDEGLTWQDHSFERSARSLPAEPPDSIRSAIGEYGWDHNTLYLYERDGELWALIEWLEHDRLRQIDPSTFAIDRGLYVGETLRLERDRDGRVERALLGAVAFERRAVGTAEGETFRIEPIRDRDDLRREALSASPPIEEGSFRDSDLVDLTSLDPTIHLDVRYATTNNFMSQVFYDQARAFLQRPAAEALVRAHRKLHQQGYGLLIHDAYRPWYVTKMFWDATPEDKKIFVANPATGSRHNRGCAVDLTLYDLETGKPVRMVGGYDEMSDRSFPDYPGGTERQRFLREVLRRAMEAEGFEVYEFEWWHFDYRDWREYTIQNDTFDQI